MSALKRRPPGARQRQDPDSFDSPGVTLIDLRPHLQRLFGHASFRAGQEDLVRTVLDGQDVLAVMPTGSGKSLGFQLPAALLPGTTLVVSPLIALMKDQVDELNRRGIAAAALHSMVTPAARRDALDAAAMGALRLLYVAPERFASEAFVRRMCDMPVARFVVDEAHCVSEWGHDFRPDYRRLRDAAASCRRRDGRQGRPPIAAFTATATPEVRDDIVALLGLAEPRVLVAGFDRPNIALSVRRVSGEQDKQRQLPGLVGDKRALVYTATRRNAELAAETLRAAGVRAAAYHAGLADAERSRVQDGFAAGDVRVVCATNAFGMGIDRPDVEAVVHTEIPGSLEAYYQEIGRAGRDGRPAVAVLLWQYADVKTREFLIDRERDDRAGRRDVYLDPTEVARRKALEHQKLRRMVSYAEAAGCLRGTILKYFGDDAAGTECSTCSNCTRRERLEPPQLLLIRKILAGVARGGERFGVRKVVAMLVGDTEGLPESLTRLSTTGLLKGEDPRLIERWVEACSAAGLIDVSDDRYRTLSLAALGREVMAGRVDDVRMAAPLTPQRAPARKRVRRTARRRGEDGSTADPLVAALRAWRTGEAKRRAIAPFVVLHDRTLEAIAQFRPRSTAELDGLPGIGPAKREAYGPTILALVAATPVGDT